MSQSMLANPKAALGFAGVVVVVAIVASFAASSFVPATEPQAEPAPVVVTEEPQAQAVQNAPAQPQASAWGSGGLSDSWSSAASEGAAPVERKEVGNISGERTQGSGNYSPPESVAASQPATSTVAGSSGREQTITSGAAPGAPPISPPPR